MPRPSAKKLLTLSGAFVLVWLGGKYLLPIVLPFLLGTLLALSAEPAVRFLESRLHLRRTAAAVLGVAVTLVLLSALLVLLGALLLRQLGALMNALPDLGQAARGGLTALEDLLLRMAAGAPDSVYPLLNRTVTGLFSSGTAIVDQLTRRIPTVASAVLGRIPGSALAIGTGILSGFMVSARLPRIRTWLKEKPPAVRLRQYLPALERVRHALFGWLKAQLKLSLVSFLIALTGMLLLGIPYAPVWALVTALVDAIPILGTGTVLLPWALVCLVRGQTLRALGLCATYAAALLCRTVLEPRLVGKQLGLDPLMTLVALYAGYRIWGFFGLLLAPVLCVCAMELLAKPA